MKLLNTAKSAPYTSADVPCSSASAVAPRSPLNAPRAFTLIEVMVVIGIIAILATLLFPVVINARARARQNQAGAEARTILMAIKAYRQEYGKWPAQWQDAQDITYISSNYLVIKPLLGSNLFGFNPKNKIFLNLQISTNRMDAWGNYLDPWLVPYAICMDENGDGSLSISNQITYWATNSDQVISNQIVLTNFNVHSVDAGVASMGGTLKTLPWNSWEEAL